MPARLTAYLPDAAAVTCWLDEADDILIGRDSAAGCCLPHPSVSRRHARLRFDGSCWQLRDAGSKNGVFVDGFRRTHAPLGPQHWLRFGDVHCEFVRTSAAAFAAAQQKRRDKEALSTGWAERLGQHEGAGALLDDTLRAVLSLAECERGCVLLPDAEGWQPVTQAGLSLARWQQAGFAGSRTALQRALAQRAPVVVNDTRGDAELASRASVLDGQIHALLALPLLQGESVLALIYADRVRAGEPISDFDLRILRAFAERAALWLATRRGLDALQRLPVQGGPALAA